VQRVRILWRIQQIERPVALKNWKRDVKSWNVLTWNGEIK